MKYVNSKVPDCLALSKNKSHIKFDLFDSNSTNDDIELYKCRYSNYCVNLKSDYTNDFFIDDDNQTWTVTRRIDKQHTKTCFYVPGNNDYFNIKRMSDQLFDAGYNFYAISLPNFGFASNVAHPQFSTFDSVAGLYKYIDYACIFYHIKAIDILFGHSTGGLIATCYTDYKNSYEPFVKRIVLSSPFLNVARYKTIQMLSGFCPNININISTGTINSTVCMELNELPCNPKYKSMNQVPYFIKWIYAINVEQANVQNGLIDVKCAVDIIHSNNNSSFDEWTNSADNSLNIDDIRRYGKLISSSLITFHELKNSIHLCFLRVENMCELLNIN
jgi:hypothetical protein